MASDQIRFRDRSFCFTGKMAELKRTQAEREARARGGQTCDIVNERLDYLVVGSIPSLAWKYGDYGTKIAKARKLAPLNRGRPRLVSEGAFMDALALVAPENSGEIDSKVVVVTYKFLAESEHSYDADALEAWLHELQASHSCHVAVRASYALMHSELFAEETGEVFAVVDGALVIECRVVKQLALDQPAEGLVDSVARGFEKISGVDGSIRWFERSEGSAGYIRLLKEVPQRLRVPGL